jgi:hypothetical protein
MSILEAIQRHDDELEHYKKNSAKSACGPMYSAIIEGGERRLAGELGESLVEAGCRRDEIHETARCEKCDAAVVLVFENDRWLWRHA